MSYLQAVLATFVLLAGFLALSAIETSRGARLFGGVRRTLDRKVGRFAFIATHVDWGSFTAHIAKTSIERIAHDLVHAILIGVRATERALTRTIRALRERVAAHEPAGEPVEGSQLIATIVRFRKTLRKEPPGKNDTVAE